MDENSGPGEIVGRFWAEERRGGSSRALSAWLLTSEDKEVAETVARLHGGRLRKRERQTDSFGVLLASDSIEVYVSGPTSVINRMRVDDGRGSAHVCDGVRFLEPMVDVGELCGCPGALFERKAAARSGRGPTPDARLVFRLAGAPEIGLFCLESSSWVFAESLSLIVRELEQTDGAVRLALLLQRSSITSRSGVSVDYVRPVVAKVEVMTMAANDVGLVA